MGWRDAIAVAGLDRALRGVGARARTAALIAVVAALTLAGLTVAGASSATGVPSGGGSATGAGTLTSSYHAAVRLTGPGKASAYSLARNKNHSLVRWNPCRIIGYKVNATRGGYRALADTKAAVRRLAQASGLRFRYDGTTREIPTVDHAPKTDDLVIAWARPSQTDALYGGAVGTGGWFETGRYNAAHSIVWQITGGYVALDSTQNSDFRRGFGPGLRRGTLLMHELGHAVGLKHVNYRKQVMYPVITSRSPGVWGAGDLHGLRLDGRASGCIGSSGGGTASSGGGGGSRLPVTPCAAFRDVAASSQFCTDITWLKAQHITHGYADGGFHPAASVSRQAMAAFLERLSNAGKAIPTCPPAPYRDVLASAFCGDVKWLKAQSITHGYADGGFHPAAPVSRGAMAAFLYRLSNPGEPDPICTKAPYRDVPASSTLCGDVQWLKAHHITGGYADVGFHPASHVSRQAMAAFLHRLAA
jgi:hypothetical protein